MKNECRTAVEGVLGRKLTDKEADLLEQAFIKASRELPQEDIKAWKSMSDEERAEAIADRAIKNYTDQIIFRAFGVVTDPDWADFEYFLEERCFPRTRDHRKDILREMGLPFYDPLLIIEKTQGRMSDDHQWIMILKKEG